MSRSEKVARVRRIFWIVATVVASALVATVIFQVVGSDAPAPRPAPKDSGFPELVGVAPAQAGCKPVERPRYQGHISVEPGERHPPYSSDPPTSGWYLVVNPEPAWYEVPLPVERVMAHPAVGGVVIWSSIPESGSARRFTRLAQKGYLMGTVWPSLKSGVVFTAWGVSQRCEKFSGAIAAAFIQAFHGRALTQAEPKKTPFV